jgi:thiol-disulfide isomerase/thioredoxin/sugar lactone lactonase YvrE
MIIRTTRLTLFLSLLTLMLVACGGATPEKPSADAEPTEQIIEEQDGDESPGADNAGSISEESEAASSETQDSEADPDSDPAVDSTEESQKETAASQSYAGKVAAPEFPLGVDWLNTAGPLSLADLRGKVVLLDFWTYGCINCIHIIPDLAKLEEKYADELVVIGVHSAKFENEGDTDNIRNIILRYELEHPVINDNQFQVWSQYGANAWPTLVLIDPDGKVLGYHSGEGIYKLFDDLIGGMVAEFDALGRIDRTPLDFLLEQEGQNNSPLLFPGKVLADGENNRLFIADSNHNRIVISDLEGNVLEVIGDGQARLRDGDSQSASFFRPQGLSLADENTLYVADTENHAIRRIDLASGQVETVAGTGAQEYNPQPGGPALSTPLNSPWDVLYHDGQLFIAMAGQHQVWAYDPDSETIRLHAGSGREELLDGKLVEGGLNQPSGLATDGQILYIADSEASAIRTADINPDGQLETIVGTGLFDFGDVDGRGDDVRLQHPLGVVVRDGLLYVADTYNSKIKIVDPDNKSSETYLGGTESGWRDGTEALLDEPGGLSFGGDNLYIADTNNHVIRVADLATGEVSTLVLVDMGGLLTRQPPGTDYNGRLATLEPQSVTAGEGTIRLEVSIPEGYKVNDLAPFSMEWISSGPAVTVEADEANQTIVEPAFPLSLSADFSPGEAELTGDLVIYYCEAESESLCLIERVRVTAPVIVTDSAGDGEENTVVVSYVIADPE